MPDMVQMDFYVHYYEVDYYKRATPWSLINYLQETAFLHADLAGDTQEVLAGEQLTWMIYKWYLNIQSYPAWKDKITVKTWIADFKSYKAFREFEIYNASGELIATASALCILVDTVKNSFKKIDSVRKEAYGANHNRVNAYDYPNFGLSGDETKMVRKFSVRLSDIDSNGHVNNARYLDWFIEDIPFETIVNHQMKSLEISYKRQVTYGQDVSVLTAETAPSPTGYKTYTGEIRDAEEKICAILRAHFD